MFITRTLFCVINKCTFVFSFFKIMLWLHYIYLLFNLLICENGGSSCTSVLFGCYPLSTELLGGCPSYVVTASGLTWLIILYYKSIPDGTDKNATRSCASSAIRLIARMAKDHALALGSNSSVDSDYRTRHGSVNKPSFSVEPHIRICHNCW